MDNATYLAMLRRRLQDATGASQRYDDPELWAYTQDLVLWYTVRGVVQFGTYVVDPNSGFTSPPTDADGLLVLTGVLLTLLTDLYNDQVNRGELGGSWKSGLEEESSADVRRGQQAVLAEIAQDEQELLIARSSKLFATRAQ